jgi:hypothetical protein
MTEHQPARVGPYVVTGRPERLGGLSGGAFGTVACATGTRGEPAIVKTCRATGGGRSNTYAFGRHYPDLGYLRRGSRVQHATHGQEIVAEVLRAEAGLLERADGLLLPNLLGVYDHDGLPAIVVEPLAGHTPRTPLDLLVVLEMLVRTVKADAIDYHGDLKPEHIFLDEAKESVRVVDPAPRFADASNRAFTPEYNPYGLAGPVADVFAIGVMLYQMLAGVDPFSWAWRPSAPRTSGARAVELPAPVSRGRPNVPHRCAEMVDAIVLSPPGELPDWAHNHRAAYERLSAAS